MVKRKDSESVAVAEAPKRSAADIGAAVAEEQQRQRRETIRRDVVAWRKLVQSVAEGHEPTTEQLRDLGGLSARLRAPADSVAVGVAALERDRDFEQQLQGVSARLRELKEREPQLRKDLEDARQRLKALEGEAADFYRVHATVPDIHRSRNENRAKAPLLFAAEDTVVEQLLRADEGMGKKTMDSLSRSAGAGWSP